jgi:hypothetical protein
MVHQPHSTHKYYPQWFANVPPSYTIGEHGAVITYHECTRHTSKQDAENAERAHAKAAAIRPSHDYCRRVSLERKLDKNSPGQVNLWNGKPYDYQDWLKSEIESLKDAK